MEHTHQNPSQRRSLSALLLLAGGSLVIGILYFGREILIPIALAILLTFILSPVVTRLRRWGLGQVPSVILTVVLTFALIATVGTMIVVELKSLADDLPAYRENIRQKISDIRSASNNESLIKVKDIAKEIVDELKQNQPSKTNTTDEATVGTNAPVVVQEKTTIAEKDPVLDSLMEQLGSAGLVVVLVVFMLLRREDLRDRVVHLAGRQRLVMTTKAIEEISQKVSRYLVRQCILNAIFGFGIAIGLSLIGLPYAVLWGFMAAIARFIPYAGPVLGAVAPVLMSLAVFNSWVSPLIVIGLILGWELLNNMVLEPVIYGQGIGVSEVALLVMMAFWTWLWGALGLVLAAPLTVCLMVICKSIPELNFISHLLGSRAALTPHQALYQRLVAQNSDEALLLVQDFLKTHTRTELFDLLILPTLLACRHDEKAGLLPLQTRHQILLLIRQLMEKSRIKSTPDDSPQTKITTRPLVVGCPAQDAIDEMALLLLSDSLGSEHIFMPVISADLDASQRAAELAALSPKVICLGIVSDEPDFLAQGMYQHINEELPAKPVVIGCWGSVTQIKGLPENNHLMESATTLLEAQVKLRAYCSSASEEQLPAISSSKLQTAT
ncbi:MAG TPA: AI-2E family transporter [Verrucomicrobiae bacterium]